MPRAKNQYQALMMVIGLPHIWMKQTHCNMKKYAGVLIMMIVAGTISVKWKPNSRARATSIRNSLVRAVQSSAQTGPHIQFGGTVPPPRSAIFFCLFSNSDFSKEQKNKENRSENSVTFMLSIAKPAHRTISLAAATVVEMGMPMACDCALRFSIVAQWASDHWQVAGQVCLWSLEPWWTVLLWLLVSAKFVSVVSARRTCFGHLHCPSHAACVHGEGWRGFLLPGLLDKFY